MDPLVRTTLAVQQGLSRVSGTLTSLLFAVALLASEVHPPPLAWRLVGTGLFATSLVYRLVRRLGQLDPRETSRLDTELFTHLSVGCYAMVLGAPGGIEGPYYAIVYALMMVAAGFARPFATAATLLGLMALEASLCALSERLSCRDHLAPHAGLLMVFAGLNLVVFRAEIARVRRLSRARVEAEIQRMKDAARSYRLGHALGVGMDCALTPPPKDAEDRVLYSGVNEIHQALQFALDLLRRTLSLKTAVLLWLNPSGTRLYIQELSTEEDNILPGPFDPRDGILAAALAQGRPVALCGGRAAKHTPYYGTQPPVGAVCAVPVVEQTHPRGLLVVDRPVREAFTIHEEDLMVAASRFMLRAVQNERVFVQLECAKREQDKLYRAANALASATTEANVVEAGVSSAREFASFDFAVVTLYDSVSNEHEICAVSGAGADQLVGQRFRHNSGLVGMAVANRHPLPYRGDYDAARQIVFARHLNPPGLNSLLVLPLLVHDAPLGTLVLGAARRGALGDAVRPTLEVLASHMAVSLSNARMLKRLEEMATTDGLTGLLNKRALTEASLQKLRSARRFHKPLSVLVCDLDHFKTINDTYGHDIGDDVIRGFAGILKRVKRDIDVVGRFGGEEFVLVCEHTDSGGARHLGERIRSELEATSFPVESGYVRVTCSVGVATFPTAGSQWETLFRSTDEALYAAKRSGRNRVTVWHPKLQGVAA
jgi:diguanylate cyclase (GGDEF)-like protein